MEHVSTQPANVKNQPAADPAVRQQVNQCENDSAVLQRVVENEFQAAKARLRSRFWYAMTGTYVMGLWYLSSYFMLIPLLTFTFWSNEFWEWSNLVWFIPGIISFVLAKVYAGWTKNLALDYLVFEEEEHEPFRRRFKEAEDAAYTVQTVFVILVTIFGVITFLP